MTGPQTCQTGVTGRTRPTVLLASHRVVCGGLWLPGERCDSSWCHERPFEDGQSCRSGGKGLIPNLLTTYPGKEI